MKPSDHLSPAVKKELTDWRLWWTRFLVITVAALAGLSVIALTWVSDRALDSFWDIRTKHWWLPLFLTPLCTALIVWITRSMVPGASGSGIPQVMAAIEPNVNESNRHIYVSLKLSCAKFFLTSWGLLAGLSIGREGPSVQIAAGIMLMARRWLPKRASVSDHSLIVAGGAAGIAAAFNTPLAGVMFAIEELSRTPEQRSSGLLIAGIVLAGLIGQSIYGNNNYFGVINVTHVNFTLIIPGILVTVASGLMGGLFSRLIIYSLSPGSADKLNLFRKVKPIYFAAGCGLVIAIIGTLTNGATFGSGYIYTRHMIEGEQSVPLTYVFFKFIVTWLTTWAGVPAGLFAPSLSIGAAIGNDIALLTNNPYAATLIALGMAGFLAAVTQAPLTSFIIVMEMVGGHAMVLSLMSCALVASVIARLLSKPLYPSLAKLQLLRLPEPAIDNQDQSSGLPQKITSTAVEQENATQENNNDVKY